MIQYDSAIQYHTHALKIADIKKQFQFMRTYSGMLNSIETDSDYGRFDNNTDLETIKNSLQRDRKAYFKNFLPNLNESIKSFISEDEIIVYYEKVENDILVWTLTNEGIESITLENGYTVFTEINTNYQRLLNEIQGLSAVNTRINEMFATVNGAIETYDTVSVVLDPHLNQLLIEYMGNDEPFIASKKVRYLPTLSSLFLGSNNDDINSVILILPDRITLNDRLEHLAIKESGINFEIIELKDKENNQADKLNLHIQQSIYSDDITDVAIMQKGPYYNQIGQCNLIFISGNDISIKNENNFVLLNMLKGSNSIVLNNTQIRDVNSAIILREFYSNLVLQDTIFNAFTGAKRKLYNNSLYSHPSYWSYTRLYSH